MNLSLSKASDNRSTSKHSRTAEVKTGAGHTYSATGTTPYNSKLRKLADKAEIFGNSNVIVLTVNPKLDNVASAGKLNPKAEAAKQMFANYRNNS